MTPVFDLQTCILDVTPVFHSQACCSLYPIDDFVRQLFEAHLTQPDEQVKDVGVVVDHSSSGHIGSKLSLTLCVQRLIEVILPLVKPVLPQCDCPADSNSRIYWSNFQLLIIYTHVYIHLYIHLHTRTGGNQRTRNGGKVSQHGQFIARLQPELHTSSVCWMEDINVL